MPTIKTLTARYFRGIVDTTLEVNDRSVVLLGENGAGKSSFVDALEFFFTSRVTHLEGAQSVSTVRHAPHIHSTRDDTTIEVEFNNPNVRVTRTFKALTGANAALQDYLRLGAESTFILRRKNLLDFILAQPGPRYQQLAAIIGVDDLDKTEKALLKARDDVENECHALTRQVTAEEAKLKGLVSVKGDNDSQLLEALNQRLKTMQETPLMSLEEVEARKLSAVAQSRAPVETQQAVQVRSLLNLAVTTLQQIGLPEEYSQLYATVVQLQQNAAEMRELLFQEVLVSGRRLIADFNLETCPLCSQPIDTASVLASIDQRVRKAQAINERSAAIAQLSNSITQQLRQQLTNLERLMAGTQGRLGDSTSNIQRYAAWVLDIVQSLTVDPVDMQLASVEELQQATEVPGCAQTIRAVVTELETKKTHLQPTVQDQKAVDLIDLLTRVMDSRNTLIQLRPRLVVKQAAHKEMAAICECFTSTKRAEVQGIYRQLEADIKRFFEMLHTDEGYKGIRLEVDDGRRASTEIQMDFHDREQEDPRAFNSEGHLDSLGLCIFLAFVKRFNSGFPLMVLDDVVSSIDAGHRQRICRLLFEEFPDYQLFITTHDYVWFEELCAHQRAYNKGHLFSNLQILDWSLDAGPRLDKYKPRWERAEDKLNNGDKDGAAADTRKALEVLLYELVLATQTPVSLRRDGKYTVDTLYSPFISRFKKLAPNVYNAHATVFQNLDVNSIFGNLLVHNNPRAGSASIEEVRGFINAVKALEAMFTCTECNQLVEYHKSANLIKCRCGSIIWATKG